MPQARMSVYLLNASISAIWSESDLVDAHDVNFFSVSKTTAEKIEYDKIRKKYAE